MKVSRRTVTRLQSIVNKYADKLNLPYPALGFTLPDPDLFGESGWMGTMPVLDVNLQAHQDWNTLTDTVAHETVHLKHPKLRHSREFNRATESILCRPEKELEAKIVLGELHQIKRSERKPSPSNSDLT